MTKHNIKINNDNKLNTDEVIQHFEGLWTL
jgi:hypothetical protein